ncbi:MAG: hypothetical protein OEU44_03635, partial [Gammaproteobacteria bacterium]|nr:hypothetical protein [Gammaproteobacteria bacterium]
AAASFRLQPQPQPLAEPLSAGAALPPDVAVRVRSSPCRPALPLLDIAKRRAMEAARPLVAGAAAALERTGATLACAGAADVAARVRSLLCKPVLPLLDIAKRRAMEAARPLVAGAAAAFARAGADAAVDCVVPADDTAASAVLPPLLMARRLASTSSRVLWVVAVCAIVNPVESAFILSPAPGSYRAPEPMPQPRPSNTTKAAPWLWV